MQEWDALLSQAEEHLNAAEGILEKIPTDLPQVTEIAIRHTHLRKALRAGKIALLETLLSVAFTLQVDTNGTGKDLVGLVCRRGKESKIQMRVLGTDCGIGGFITLTQFHKHPHHYYAYCRTIIDRITARLKELPGEADEVSELHQLGQLALTLSVEL